MTEKEQTYNLIQHVGFKTRELRKSYGLTQEQLAERLEVHPSYVGQLERGEREASIRTLKKISDTFDLSLAEFLKDEKENHLEQEKHLKSKCVKLLNQCSSRQLSTIYQVIKAMLHKVN